MAWTEVNTTCGFCHACCGMKVRVEDGAMVGVRGNREHPANEGKLCAKGLAAAELVHSPDRVTSPLKRTPDGFKPVSWDEALDMAAARLGEIRDTRGPQAIMLCRGAPVTREADDGYVQLLAALGSPNATGVAHLCSTPRRTGANLVFGNRPTPDFDRTRCMVLWGANPTDSMRLAESAVYGRYDRVIPRARKRGARLVVIDPRRTELAASADIFLQVEPGTDRALALAMLNVVIGRGLYDREFVERWTVGFDRLAAHVEPYTPAWAEGKTWVKASTIQEAARVYASTRPALIREGNGLEMHVGTAQTVQLTSALTAITGNLDVPGGNAFFPLPPLSPYPTIKPQGERFLGDRYPLHPQVAFPALVDALADGAEGAPRAIIVHHANPALANANARKVRQALQNVEFMVVSDLFLTATAQLADLVLPDASDFERVGFQATGMARGGLVSLQERVVEPQGQSRSALEVEYELAQRMGVADCYPWRTTEEWANFRLNPSEVTVDDLRELGFAFVTPPMEYRQHLRRGLPTPSGRVELCPDILAAHGYDPLPGYDEPPGPPADARQQYPLLATCRRPQAYVHTKFRNLPALKRLHPEPLIRIHPEDAAARGVGDGDETAVVSCEGAVRLRALVTDEVRAGQVCIDSGWGNPWDGMANVNALASDEPRDPISASTPNRRLFCQVRKA